MHKSKSETWLKELDQIPKKKKGKKKKKKSSSTSPHENWDNWYHIFLIEICKYVSFRCYEQKRAAFHKSGTTPTVHTIVNGTAFYKCLQLV